LIWSGGAAAKVDPQLIGDFTKKTGISVHVIPASESASHRLQQELAILQHAPKAVDVLEIDTTWPPILADYLADLRDATRDRTADEVPQVVENATIRGRVIGAPFLVEYGMLYYRTDLLQKYGFAHPPATWNELEIQAARIQRGERAAGHSGFWGYVWQGAEYEGLTCNALEWQSSQGGGNLLENHSVNVNNRAAIRAFARAAGWIGTISPPGITAYLEEDSRNIWQGGSAAFLRSWSYVYPLARSSPIVGGHFAVTPIPSELRAHSSVIGGSYLALSRATQHSADAIQFVRFMTGAEAQKQRAIQACFLPTLRSVYRDPALLQSSALFAMVPTIANRALRRPVSLAGAEYDRVSQIYAGGIHKILTGHARPARECGRMQTELCRLTGLASRGE
jgi:trehalose/maltose transport system substrate-binding protein